MFQWWTQLVFQLYVFRVVPEDLHSLFCRDIYRNVASQGLMLAVPPLIRS